MVVKSTPKKTAAPPAKSPAKAPAKVPAPKAPTRGVRVTSTKRPIAKPAVKSTGVKKPHVNPLVKKPVGKVAGKPVTRKPNPTKVPAQKRPLLKKSNKVASTQVAVKPITDSTGVVTLKSVDDPGTATEGKAASLSAILDKETGVVTMVPDTTE